MVGSDGALDAVSTFCIEMGFETIYKTQLMVWKFLNRIVDKLTVYGQFSVFAILTRFG